MWMWDSRTHQYIVAQALQRSPASFCARLQRYQHYLILGIETPDRILRDFYNHCWHCTPTGGNHHYGGAIATASRTLEFLNWQASHSDTLTHYHKLPSYICQLLNDPLKSFVFHIGMLTHYVADLHQPFHTDGSARFPHEETVHKVMEQDTRLHLQELTIELHRRRRICAPQDYFLECAFRANERYDALIDAYFLRPGKVRPRRWKDGSPAIEQCITEAAQSVANLFLTIEDLMASFRSWDRRDALLKRVEGAVNNEKSYRFRKYPSGTVALYPKINTR